MIRSKFGVTAFAASSLLLSACGEAPAPARAGATPAGPPAASAGTTVDRERVIAAIDSVVHELLASGWVPGISLGVVLGADTLVLRGYGLAHLQLRTPMTAETVLPFGSILKQLTAAAILRLVERGDVRLDQSVREFFPEFPREWQPVTVHHLLNHSSGIPRTLAAGWERRERSTRQELLQELAERGALEFAPGERWAYNNGGYVVLALILEKLTGEPYDDHLHRTLLEPLGMRSTGNSDRVGSVLPQAMGYDTVQGRLVQRPISGNVAAVGAGFYHSTAGDLLAWQQALRSGRVLRPETFARMTSPTILNDGEAWPYGYGVWLREFEGRRRIAHGGIVAGFRPFLGYLPDADLAVVVLINSGAADPWIVGESLLRSVLTVTAPPGGSGQIRP